MKKNNVMRTSNKLKRKVSPMEREQNRRTRPIVRFDGQNLTSRLFPLNLATNLLTGVGSQIFLGDCSNTLTGAVVTPTFGLSQQLQAITTLYEDYMITSLNVQWFPAVSPADTGANARIYIAIDDNPEHITTYATGTVTNLVTRIKSDRNVKFFNAWERMNFNLPLPSKRQKKFGVNNNLLVTDNNDVNRTVQFAVITACDGGPIVGPTPLGEWIFTTEYTLLGLSGVPT